MGSPSRASALGGGGGRAPGHRRQSSLGESNEQPGLITVGPHYSRSPAITVAEASFCVGSRGAAGAMGCSFTGLVRKAVLMGNA